MKNNVELIADYPIVVSYPVLWGDQDAFGHVNGNVYLRWFESARFTLFSRVRLACAPGIGGVGPILAAVSCRYRSPLTYPDTVHVGIRVAKIGKSSIQMEHAIVSESRDSVVAEGQSTIVVIDFRTGKPVPVPKEVRGAIRALRD